MKHLNFTEMLTAATLILLSEILFAQWNKESINNSPNNRSLNKGDQFQMTGWVPTNGPYSGNITSFGRISASGPEGVNFIFVGTIGDLILGDNGGRIFRSQDGENWAALNNYPTHTGSAISSITSMPNSPSGFILFASSDYGWLGSGYAGVYRSTDYGDTWNPVLNDPFSADISSLVVIGTTIFAGNYLGGVFRSTDFGDNWSLLNGITDGVNTLLADGTNIIVGSNNGGVFISTDNGDSWRGMGLANLNIKSLAVNDSNIFVGTFGNGIFRSSNYGQDWFTANNGLLDNRVTSLAVNETIIYAANFDGGVFYSTNYGNSWTELNNGLKTATDYTTIGPLFFDYSTGYLYAGSFGDGIFRLAASSKEWSQVNRGLTNTTINTIVTKVSGNESFLFAGCKSGNGRGVFRSTNIGEDWFPVNTGLPHTRDIYALMFKDDILFAGTDYYGVFRSTNNGDSWISTGLAGLYVTCFAVTNEYLFAGYSTFYGGGVQRSTDYGSSWISTSLTGVEVSDLAIIGDNLFASTRYWDGVFKSTDNGDSWSSVGLSNYLILSLAVIGSDLFAGTVYGVFRYDGVHWKEVNNGLPAGDIYDFAVYGNNLFAATWEGVFLSTNYGSSWSNESTGLENYSVSSLGIFDNNLLAATVPGSIWHRPLSEIITDVNDTPSQIPDRYSLEQNFPNPFNPSTTIKYSIPTSEFVTFKVFDVLGNEVATLVNEEKPNGSYQIDFDATGLSSGIYFYKLSAGNFVETKKMILLK